ncbi:P-loop containing nucleoside triphosphate hydrolase protein [Rhodotorula diobovata]|uniref:DNA 3'-5' helicase n=1 Tax=Rhodotorula diobovata TaxID=5288 RepID=A0A5C5FW14_9BASI|nr:P-loop containing nucleoside triphosphate hydrolase protein [Rhodotorula diobovata]
MPGGGGGTTVRKQGIKLRPVSELPDAFRSLWRFGVFNAVQSVCFDTVYKTDENVVVSAPTGAGKTVLFELAILRLFTSSPSNEAKVLYMAPTKSLCSERTLDWKRKFEHGLGWAVQELTGDSDTSTSAWREFANARIIVTTPEKWDAMTRKWHDHGSTLAVADLACSSLMHSVDEVHSVGADVRGAVLEVVVSRMKTLGTSTRFVAVSATVPNIHDVAEWLGASPSSREPGSRPHSPAKVFQFDDEFRPCKLQKVVIGYPRNGNEFAFANALNFKLFELVRQYSSGKPVLIFCNTRKGCLQAAEALAKEYKQALAWASSRARLAWPKPPRSEYKTSDKHLAALLENGIATHHAGMDSNDRRLVERLFVDGSISIVCSTSTLAVGVNLPARMVIIRGTKAFIDGQNKDYSDLEVLQMIGRAGRPQFDTTGIGTSLCVLTAAFESCSLLTCSSCSLHKTLTEHVNSEITLRTITDVQSGLHWLRSTFLYVRITKNPAYYAIGGGKMSPEQRLEEICLEAIKELVDSGVVDRQEDELSATPLTLHASPEFGDIMSKFYISHKTFLALKDLPLKSNMRTLLETLSASTEFSSYRFRQGEKSTQADLAFREQNLRFPTAKVSSTADRVMILIQLVLDGVPGSELKTDNINPLLDARAIFSAAVRIIKCMVDVGVEREDGAIRTMLELLRSLNGRCWDGSSFVLRQLDGVGEKSYKVLVTNGIKGFEDVRACEPDRLEVLLGRKPPYGRKLIAQATTLPQFEVTLTAGNEEVLSGHSGVQVELSVDLRLVLTKPLPAVKKGTTKLWVSLATTTSDGEFIDFRRTRIDSLLKSPKQFDLSVVLVKPSQRIVVSASCDLIAGSEVKAVYKPETRASEFPIPSTLSHSCAQTVEPEPWSRRSRPDGRRRRRPGNGTAPSASFAFSSSRSCPALIRSHRLQRPAQQPIRPQAKEVKSKVVRAAQQTHDSEEDEPAKATAPAPRRRPDGKYECNHACGTLVPPRPRTRAD